VRRRFRLISVIVTLIVMILIVGLFVLVFGRMDKTIEAPGTVAPARSEHVKPRIDGVVRDVLVREGDTVKAGDTLAVLRADEIELAVDRSKRARDQERTNLLQLREAYENLELSASFEAQWAFANVYQAKRRAESAREKYERAEELYANNLISVEERDDKRLEHELAQSYYTSLADRIEMMKRQYEAQIAEQENTVALAEREYVLAREKLERTFIVTPVSGVVLTPGVEGLVGTRVSTGASIMEVGDLAVMNFIARVREADIPHVREGQVARIFINAFPHRHYKVFHGEVVASSPRPEITGAGVVFETTVRIDDPWVRVGSSTVALKPGLSGKVKVVVKHKVRLIEIVFKLNR
jgi:multidrug resistance efflux pump